MLLRLRRQQRACLQTVLLISRSVLTPWTVAHQAPLSVIFPRQEYWSGLPVPSPGDFPDSGIEFGSLASAAGFFTTQPPGKPLKAKGNNPPESLIISYLSSLFKKVTVIIGDFLTRHKWSSSMKIKPSSLRRKIK